jgi:RNA polymerase sigma factor (TIGR02999 family)
LGQITSLLERVHGGDTAARDELFASAYSDLRRMAHARLRGDSQDGMLETGALVHETYLRFLQSGSLQGKNRHAFFAYAAKVMRSVIVDSARECLAQRRGGGLTQLTWSTTVLKDIAAGDDSIIQVHEALQVLEQADARLARVVEMRYFGGFTEGEIAQTLGLTERTIQRDWEKAKLILAAALK